MWTPQVQRTQTGKRTAVRARAGPHCIAKPTGVQPSDLLPLIRTATEVEKALCYVQPPVRTSSSSSAELRNEPDVSASWLRAAPESNCAESPDLSDADVEPVDADVPRIVVERAASLPPTYVPTDTTKLGAELVKPKSRVQTTMLLYTDVPPALQAVSTVGCFFFRTLIRGQTAHALADTGAAENFVSTQLAQHLGIPLHFCK